MPHYKNRYHRYSIWRIVGYFILYAAALISSSDSEESSVEVTQGFISDDLFIYMHSGAGNNFRILGSINSGTEIKLTGLTENEYTQIIDNKNRKAWVESKYVSTTPGLRFVIAELSNNSKFLKSFLIISIVALATARRFVFRLLKFKFKITKLQLY